MSLNTPPSHPTPPPLTTTPTSKPSPSTSLPSTDPSSYAESQQFLTSLLSKTLRIAIRDPDRFFTGSFKCIDRDANVILSNAFEHRLPSVAAVQIEGGDGDGEDADGEGEDGVTDGESVLDEAKYGPSDRTVKSPSADIDAAFARFSLGKKINPPEGKIHSTKASVMAPAATTTSTTKSSTQPAATAPAAAAATAEPLPEPSPTPKPAPITNPPSHTPSRTEIELSLSRGEEVTKSSHGVMSRFMGLIVIPGHEIVKVEVEERGRGGMGGVDGSGGGSVRTSMRGGGGGGGGDDVLTEDVFGSRREEEEELAVRTKD